MKIRKALCLVLALATMLAMMPAFSLTAAAEGDKVVIEIMDWNGGEQEKSQKAAVEEYMKLNPNVEIKHQTVTQDYMSKLNTLVAADQTPDIYYIAETSAIDWGINGVAMDLVPLYEAQGINMQDKFIESAMFGTDGKVYGLAYGLVDIVMFFNKTLFDEKGVAYPSQDANNPIKWDEYVEMLKQLTVDMSGNAPGTEGFQAMRTKTYGVLIPKWFPAINALLYSNNASYFNEDGTDFAMDSDAGKHVLQSLYELSEVHQVAPTAIATQALPGTVQMFKDGQLATAIAGSYEYPNYINEGIDVGIAPLPMFEKPATVSWASCNEISAKTENVDEVFKFFRWYVEGDTNPAQLDFGFPNAKAFYEDQAMMDEWLNRDLFNDDFKKVIPEQMANTTYVPEPVFVKNAAQMLDEIIMPTLDNLFTGEKTVDEVCATIREKLEGKYNGRW